MFNSQVFNGPFHEIDKTYYMRLSNVSNFRVAFTVKTNALSRLEVSPYSFVLQPKQKIEVAVTVKVSSVRVSVVQNLSILGEI